MNDHQRQKKNQFESINTGPCIRTIKTPNFEVSSLEEANAVVERIRSKEVYAEPRHVRFLPSGCLEANGHQWPLSDIGLESLCRHIRLPVQYARRISVDLLATNVNRLLSETTSDILVRAQEWPQMTAIAITCVIGGRYRPLPYQVLLKCLGSAQKSLAFQAERINLSPSLFRAEVTMGKENPILPGDYFRYGCELIASENALVQSVSIRSYIYRLVCTNGAVLPETFEHMSFKPSRRTSTEQLISFLEHGITRSYKSAKDIDNAIHVLSQQRLTVSDSAWLYEHLRRRVPVEILGAFHS